MTAPLTAWLATQGDAMLALLEEVVNIDSNSYDKPGVDAVGQVFERFFTEHDIDVERIPQATTGDILRAHVPSGTPTPGNAPIILMGHLDTVFPKGEVARRPFAIRDGRAYGPGVTDMKSGLVLNAFVMAAYKTFGGNPYPLIALMTSDEEIGSAQSRATIEATARGARAVFNAEPGRPSGNVVSGRKGCVFMVLEVAGVAAHSGVNFQVGRSANHALAQKIVELVALTDLSIGVTLNVGLMSGGVGVNTTSPRATAEVDLRYIKSADRDRLLQAIEAIVAAEHVPDTTGTLRFKGGFPPLEQTPADAALFAAYQEAARATGFEVGAEFTGGCADSGFTSAVGTPTLCATGPVGGRAHTPDEYLEVDTVVPRALAVARAIAACAS